MTMIEKVARAIMESRGGCNVTNWHESEWNQHVKQALDDARAAIEAIKTEMVMHEKVATDYGRGWNDCVTSIADEFGEDIALAIRALTRGAHETYSDFILRAKANPIARRVKIADIKENMRPGAEHLLPRYKAALEVLLSE